MKLKKMISLLLVICMVIPISINNLSVYASNSIPEDYNIRWRFESNRFDENGNVHINQDWVGSVQFDNTVYKEGNYSAYFDGSTVIYSWWSANPMGDGLYNLSDLGTNNQITVSSLVRIEEDVSQGIWEFLTSYNAGLYIEYNAFDKKIHMDFMGTQLQSSEVIEIGEWYLVTYIWDGDDVKLYINGKISASDSYLESININSGYKEALWVIGNRGFNGFIDDMVIYGRELTPTEIETMYNSYFPEEITQHTVSFDVDGGTPVPTQTVDYNGKATRPVPAPTKTGHTFDGWYTDGSFTTDFDFENTPITQDTSVFGKWDINQYTVAFNSQGGSPVASQTRDFNTLLTPPEEPVKTGYSFGGWYKDVGYFNQWIFATDVVTGNTTLYGKWNINQYTVSFNVDGGSPVANQTIDHNGKAISPVPPTKTGYTFGGWYTD
ncbi:MAG: InlB B-repeat-containing protein, partial [Clostridiaceae bacterium]|nr:InlB B-repeat-containing protein [Clostridiaceae bacterium]